MRKILFWLALASTVSWAESTKTVFNPFTGKLDYITKVDSTTLPSNSPNYIQNTLTPTTTSQSFAVANASFSQTNNFTTNNGIVGEFHNNSVSYAVAIASGALPSQLTVAGALGEVFASFPSGVQSGAYIATGFNGVGYAANSDLSTWVAGTFPGELRGGTVLGFTNSQGTIPDVEGLQALVERSSSTVTNIYPVFSDWVDIAGFGTVTNAFQYFAGTPLVVGNSAFTNIGGLYIKSQKPAAGIVTNTFGVYQAGSGDQNAFAGGVIIGTFTAPTSAKFSLVISTSTTGYTVGASTMGHLNGSGSIQPTITSCGTGTPVVQAGGNDWHGTINVGGGVVTSCTLTFTTPWQTNPPDCVVSDNGAAISSAVTSKSQTAITIGTSATLGGGTISYICVGSE